MWRIGKPISLGQTFEGGKHVWDLPDITHLLAPDDLERIGINVWEGFKRDKLSRAKWEKRTQAAMDMAMQIQKGKTFPWPGCANVVFPLVSIACLQFHSRAYPALIGGTDIVKYRVIGDDETGAEAARAQRIGSHMSFQVLEDDPGWEEQHDRLLLNVPIVGCAFVKSFHSPHEKTNISELVLAQDLVVDYYAKSIEKASRKSQLIPLSRNEIYTAVIEGRFRDVLDEDWYKEPAKPLQYEPGKAREDVRTGQNPPLRADADTPYVSIEQHCRFDLDGDGYAEPWIVTIESNSRRILRIVAGWDSKKQMEYSIYGRLSCIRSTEYYTKYGFVPSPDGGIYDVGFGVLLGPLNAAVNSIINQILDAGTLQTTAGGFLARGATIRGGQYTFNQFGWNRVDATGDDLRKSIFPLPTREPSPVLFQMLQFLVEYTQRLSGSTDALQGMNPGQNTPASTQQSMVEQGSRIYSALFKRMWRCMKEEFKKLYCLNAVYLPDTSAFGSGGHVLKQDYLADPKHIAPVADPNVVSDQQLIQRAAALAQRAQSVPGYNMEKVERNLLQAMRIDGIDSIYPGPQKVPPLPNPRAALEQAKAQGRMQELQFKAQSDLRKFALDLTEKQKLNKAKIMQLEAQAANLVAQAGAADIGKEVAALNALVGALKTHDESMRAHVDQVLQTLDTHHENQTAALGLGVGGMGNAPGDAGLQGGAGAQAAGAYGGMGEG